MSRRQRPFNLAKVQSQAAEHFGAGRFYEAQQLYQSMYNRLSARNQFKEAASLLEDGTFGLLEHKQGNAAGELGIKLMDTYKQAGTDITDETVDRILKIYKSFPPDSEEVKRRFMRAAIKLTTIAGKSPEGDPRLHYAHAQHLSQQNMAAEAQRFWLRSGHPAEHANNMIQWSQQGYEGERDLFLARTVLQYCCLQDLESANTVFELFTKAYPSLDSPLLNFIRYLLKTLERDAQPLFVMLRHRYATAIQRDESFKKYLDRIGHVYYNMEAPKGMMADILSMLK